MGTSVRSERSRILLGLCLGARTGQLIAALVAGRDPGIDMAPYRIDRFQARGPRSS